MNHTSGFKKTPNIRAARLRKTFWALNIVTLVIDLPWMFLPVPYLLFSILSLLPLPICLALYCIFPQNVTLAGAKKVTEDQASCLLVMGVAVIFPLIRALDEFHVLQWAPLVMLSCLSAAVFSAIVLPLTREWREKTALLMTLLFVLALYSAATILHINYIAEGDVPQQQTAIVLDHSYEQSGKTTKYYLTLKAENGKRVQIRVDSDCYSTTNDGDTLNISLHDGALGVPFLLIE